MDDWMGEETDEGMGCIIRERQAWLWLPSGLDWNSIIDHAGIIIPLSGLSSIPGIRRVRQ